MGGGGFGRLDDVDDGKGIPPPIKCHTQIYPCIMLLVLLAMNLVDCKISNIMLGTFLWESQ